MRVPMITDTATFVEMWNSRVSIDRMAEHFGVSRNTISRHARRIGLPPREVADKAPYGTNKGQAWQRRKAYIRRPIETPTKPRTARITYAEVIALADLKKLTYRQALCQLHRTR